MKKIKNKNSMEIPPKIHVLGNHSKAENKI